MGKDSGFDGDATLLAGSWDADHVYTLLDLRKLEDPSEINGPERYRPGDMIRVPRSDHSASAGVVIERLSEGMLRVEVQIKGGRAGLKEMTAEQVREMNPLKVGDYIELRGRPFWVAGIDRQGEIVVLDQAGQRVDPIELRREAEHAILNGFEETQRLGDPLFRASTRTGPRPMARPIDSGRYVPIESILKADPRYGLVAGNKETDTVYGLKSPMAGAALHTHKGHFYKDWNEDGGALFADRLGRLYVGVFDQAGGEGTDDRARGAAAAIAAQALFDRMKAFADHQGTAAEAEQALIAAATDAHEALLRRGLGEVTTFIGGLIEERLATIVNVGDSGAMHFSKTGRHIASTEEQGIGRILLEGLGKHYHDGRNPDFKIYRWPLNRGEYLVFGSDGLLDAKLGTDEIGAIVAEAGTAADATRALRDVTSQRMKMKKGKPDNLTVLVVRVGEP